ncbi:MAG: hypothetical protein JRD05_10750 [Deltaproteobacteria bacterium]|nr:hypothetical protein [Deltaproteobacteria bacterium]
MDIEHPTSNSPKASKHLSASGGSNVEWENLKKQSLKPELLNDIFEETEESIKIFVTSIKTAEKKRK